MDGKLALIHVNNLLKYENVYDNGYLFCIDPAVEYMKNNPDDPESKYLLSFIDEAKERLRARLDKINKQAIYKEIKSDFVADYYIKSLIPFKSQSQNFSLLLLCRYAEAYTHNFNFFYNIAQFLLSDKFINDSRLFDSLVKHLDEKYLYYDVWQNQNGVDNTYINEALRNDYILGYKEIKTNDDTDKARFIIGHAAEAEFYSVLRKNISSDDIIIWVSRNVNPYESLDFIVYNMRRNFARVHEVKGTVLSGVSDATITKEESKVLDLVVNDLGFQYSVDRLKLDPNLKGIVDFSEFRMTDVGQLSLYDIEGRCKPGYGLLHTMNASGQESIMISNIAEFNKLMNSNQGTPRTRL